MPPDPELVWFDTISGASSEHSAWAEAYSFTDVWRWKYSSTREYTCHSATHKSFSHNDLEYVRGPLLPKIQQVTIIPRGISDHAPVLLQMSLSGSPWDKLCRLSRLWISNSEVALGFRKQLTTYWTINPESALESVVWDFSRFYARQRHLYKYS